MYKYVMLGAVAKAIETIGDAKVKAATLKVIEELDKDLEDGGFDSSADYDEAYDNLTNLFKARKVEEELEDEIHADDETEEEDDEVEEEEIEEIKDESIEPNEEVEEIELEEDDDDDDIDDEEEDDEDFEDDDDYEIDDSDEDEDK
jgi:hypothetical protein